MTIGERIKKRREELGMTQEELALKCGYKSRSSINKIELSRDLPLKKVKLMADALQTTPSDLMGWLEEMEELQQLMEKDRTELKIILEENDSDDDVEERQVKISHAVDKYLDTVKAFKEVTRPEEHKEVGYRAEIQDLVKEARKSSRDNVLMALQYLKGLNAPESFIDENGVEWVKAPIKKATVMELEIPIPETNQSKRTDNKVLSSKTQRNDSKIG